MTPHRVAGGEAKQHAACRIADPAAGATPHWRNLARLVAAAVAALEPPLLPALVGIPDPARAGIASMTEPPVQPMHAIDSSVRLPRPSRRPSPFPRSNDATGARSPSDLQEEIGEEHLECWALVKAAQGGDGEAFGKLYDRYVDSVFRFIYYRVNDRALAEDFTSETFLRALRRISAINYQGRDIGAWFMTIARNIVFDHSKSARFRLEITTGDVIEGEEREASTETAVLAHLTNERLMAAVNTLNEEQKECVVLRFLNGLSVAETAEVMGKNDGAIKALQHRAIKRLAALVADELR